MESLNNIFTWISHNPAWGSLGVFLIAFFESLALVGLVLPGAAMMFGIGALVGTDILPLLPTLFWAALGAIGGDGVSFWLGRRYHMQLKTLWPLSKHPELISNATDFFYRHGGKSILFGRFIGPIRPVIPAVAGMMAMSTRRFVLFNIISGVLWAPVYVLPGMIFTTSLGLAAEVASRLAVMVGSLLAILVIVLWLSRVLFNWLHRYTYPLMQRLLWWSRLHPVVGRIPASLLDPNQPEARGLTLMALLLFGASLLFSLLIESLGREQSLLSGLDHSLHQTLQHLRTPEIDQLMILFSTLGDIEILLPLFLLTLLWLLYSGLRRAALHWLAAIGVGALLGLALFGLGQQIDALSLTQHAIDNALLLATVSCFGFLSVLIARELPLRHRWLVYTLAGLLICAISVARLYLGIHHLEALAGVLSLGMAWVSLLGIGYRNHPAERVAPLRLSLLVLLVVTGALISWHAPPQWTHGPPSTPPTIEITAQQWLQKDAVISRYRADLRGHHTHPLNLHYLGEPEALEALLKTGGWRRPPAVDVFSWLVWLNPATPLSQLPVLPQIHDGRYHHLLLTREDDERLLSLRLWKSPYRIGKGQQPLWLGSISELRAESRGGLTVPRTQTNFADALQQFRRGLKDHPAITLLSKTDNAILRIGLKSGL